MADKKGKVIDTVTELGGSAAGAAVGAAIGTAVAGPLGTVGGALAGTIIEKGLLWVGNEIKDRMLSPKEEVRVGAVYTYATQKINNRESLKTHVVMQKRTKYGKIVLQGGVSNAIRNMG